MRWMKALLAVSLALNLVAIGGLVYLFLGAAPAASWAPAKRPESTLEWVRYDLEQDAQWSQMYHPWSLDAEYWRQHRAEIEKGIEVVDEEQADDIRAVFYRYTVGSKVFKNVLWMRRIGDVWWSTYEYFSSYADDPFSDGQGARAKQLIERVQTWQQESAKRFGK